MQMFADGHHGLGFGGPRVGSNTMVGHDHSMRTAFQTVPAAVGPVTFQQCFFDGLARMDF